MGSTGDNRSHVLKTNVRLDGYDSSKKIGFEFISNSDYNEWFTKISELDNQMELDRYENIAKKLDTQLKQKSPEIKVGILYEPSKYEKNESEENLRQQVNNFIQWLKAGGMI